MAVGQQVTTTRGSALDWIFVRGPLTFEKGAIQGDAKASDHFPLTVVIRLDPQSASPATQNIDIHRRQMIVAPIPGCALSTLELL
jgi:hypothetical protein